jgi:hypothetical protein
VANEVVARFLDGKVIKGVSLDVDPNRPICHVRTGERRMVEVKLTTLKALYFVKDLVGDAKRDDSTLLAEADERSHGSYPIDIEFIDGERLVGFTVRYPPIRPFFFVLPADVRSNNIRVLVNRAAVKRMQQPAGG